MRGGRGSGRSPRDLLIQLRFEGDVHGVNRVAKVLTTIERLVREFHDEELAAAAEALELRLAREKQPVAAGPIVGQAQSLFRTREVRASSQSRIERAATGSLIIEIGVVGGICFWILEKTLGASFGEAWKKSKAGQRITNWLIEWFDKEVVPGRLARLRKKLSAQLRIGTIHVRSLETNEQKGAVELILADSNPPVPLPEADR